MSRHFLYSFALVCCAGLGLGMAQPSYAVTVPEWKELPLACLPERAVPWNQGKVETQQASCHCPPMEDCPKINNGWPQREANLNDSNWPFWWGRTWNRGQKLPPEMITRCCPVPQCPKGTAREGELWILGMDCNKKPTCPNGLEPIIFTINRIFVVCNQSGCRRQTVTQKLTSCQCPRGFTQVGNTCIRQWNFGGGSSCFIKGTQVTMADGTRKAIETLVPGDLLRGHTSDNRVLSLETPKLGERKLYRINGSKAFVTAEHPFLTKDGWKSIDPLSTAKEHASLGVKSLQVGDILITEQGESAVTSIEGATDDAERIVYNPQLTGDHTYYADGLLAHNKKDDCVRADSLVTRADGSQIAIDQVKVGDRLKGPEGDVEVTQISRIEGDAYVFYRINDLKFRITGSHPLQTTDGWKELDAEGRHADSIVGRLEVGDKLVGKDGTTIEVKRIEVDPGKGGTETAVNISTRDDKPFFVGDIIIKPFNEIEFSF